MRKVRNCPELASPSFAPFVGILPLRHWMSDDGVPLMIHDWTARVEVGGGVAGPVVEAATWIDCNEEEEII